MMQSLHHQQQQLAALLSVALPKDDSTSSATASDDDSSRLAALNSLHRAILYPPNSVLITHSATFLVQGFSQLLTDVSYAVRQSAVVAYGALCAVVSSIPISSNGRQNHVLLGSLVDRFIGWALPLLSNAGAADETKELALEGLREFLSVGDVVGTERYALPILKACQVLLEDERTSLNLLPRILGVLNLISLKFMRCFQPHFVDIVDLLLGWALVPDLTESDRRIIMDSFLQFQKYWVGNLQISLGLLSKFLGDMDVLLQDGSPGTPQQFHRLLALLSCFCTILQSTASGLLEMNLLEQISEPLGRMLPSLLACVSLIGQKFGWSEWIGDSWKCLTLLAEILRDRFSTFYPLAVDVLFRSLEVGNSSIPERVGKIASFQVHGVLKTNLQLLSLQKQGLLPSSVRKLLYFHSPISQLRLHPNHLVTGGSAATYVFLLQHGNDEVVNEALALLMEELESLKDLVGKFSGHEDEATNNLASKAISKPELFALMKFDLKVLLACVDMAADGKSTKQTDIVNLNLRRTEKLVSFVTKNLDPFNIPIQAYVELQVNIIKTMDRLAQIEYLTKCSIDQIHCSSNYAARKESVYSYSNLGRSMVIIEQLDKYSTILGKALHDTAPLAVKLVAFDWLHKFCENVIAGDDFSGTAICSYESFGYVGVVMNLVRSVLGATYDREPDVRSRAAVILEKLLQAKIVHPIYFYQIADVILEKLGDPDIEIKNAYVRLLADLLSTTVYACGLSELENSKPGTFRLGDSSSLHWRQIFALKQLPQQLQSKQLVSILSYISRRWKAPLSSWIQRLISNCKTSKDSMASQSEDTRNLGVNVEWTDTKVDEDIIEKSCSVNNLAGAWWAVQEAARYCISSRLRTNLGGPTQTFAALERMLLDIAHILQLDSEQNEGNLSMIGSSGAHLLPMRLLLEFVEALKKNVYNAYEGSVILPSVTRQSSLFFRANRKVCEEWFSRICEPMMNAGLSLHCNDATIQYCVLRLQEVKNLVGLSLKDKPRNQGAENIQNTRERYMGDFLKIVQHISLALCRSYEPAALIGLQRWISMTFSPLLVDENQSFVGSGTIGLISWITGLVYQAKGEYENAAAHFTHMLQNEEALSSLGSDGVQFVIARVIECYTAVSDWKSLESWLLELQTLRAKHAGKSYSGALTTAGNEINAIHALAHFDEGDYQAAWACLDLTPKSSGELTLDPKLALHRSKQMLLQALLLSKDGKSDMIPNELQKARSMLEEMLSVLPLDGLIEAAPYAIQLHCIHTLEENFKFKSIHDKPQHLPSMLNSYVLSVLSPMSGIVQDCKPWLNVLRVYQNEFATSPVTLKLGLNLLNLARKQSNLVLANRLNNYAKDHAIICSDERHRDVLISNLQYESILLQYAENKFEDAFSNLWSFVLPCMISEESKLSDVADRILKARACLKLSDWLRRKYSDWNPNNLVPNLLAKLDLDENSSLGKKNNLSSETKIGLIIEEIVGTFTKLSTRICPTMGKSWISYAAWCFQQAKDTLLNRGENVLESCSFSPVLGAEVIPDRYRLTEDEMKRIEFLVLHLLGNRVDPKSSRDEREKGSSFFDDAEDSKIGNSLQDLVMQVVNIIETVSGSPSAENSGSGSLSTLLSSQLKSCLSYANAIQEDSVVWSTLDGLVDIWWSLRRRKVSLFGHAAHGYIQYLSCSSQRLCHGEMAGSDSESKKKKGGSYTLRATLYVLHILLNYGVELKDTLEPSLSMVPLLPWQEVIPQLFARLSSHPEEGIRKQLEALLIMLAKQSPWSIVYPTLVDVNAYEENPSEELQNVLGCLKELYPRLVQDVQLMIIELGNVTVLWEELWLSTLQDLHTDVMRRINVLREEAARISDNMTLSQSEKNKINAARYSAMMAPIVVSLERRLASTSRKPETPHEVWFQAEYGEQLKSAILSFKTPPASAAAVGDVWRPFDSIAASLASYQRKSSISLKDVAPQLALLSSSDVPMPGLEKPVKISASDSSLASNLRGIVTIASFSEQVIILSTKTKPKKLCILGSDGKEYTYLLKGREDLRLDARIMQLLQAVDGFLCSSPSTCHNSPHIRYYSVTPISGRAGLIQWVDNVVSIYSIFKAWQSRAQLAQLATTGSGNTKGSAPPPIPRPSDMFYGKIIPALKEKGIRRVISRRDWPHEVKRKVLVDLMKEVPRQLLYQELWCASVGYKAFSLKQKRYSGSVAAMSIVGHVLGLGDRHLDNILIDFCSGDIVHIDYNVSFDKGQRLKIPEIVPFRLTQMIEAALGLTGLEGSFRANCEAVAGVLRKNKDIILMLLEVFVWDPLIEWTRGDFHDDAAIGGEERKGMELAVSLSLFASRVQEIRVPLQEHHDLLLTTLPAVESALERFAEVLVQYELASALFYRADQERSNLILHETSAKSMVTEATSTSEKIRASFEIQAREFKQAKALVLEKAQEATTWVEQHGRILDALRNSLIPEVYNCTKLSNLGEALSLTSSVTGAGVPLTVVPEPTQVQCYDIDREVSQLMAELDEVLASATIAIQAYSFALQRILPLNYLTTSAMHSWAQVLQLAANAVSSDVFSLARRQASELFSKFHVDHVDSTRSIHDDLCMKVEKYALDIENFEEECKVLEDSVGLEAETKAKDRILSAFVKYMQSSGLISHENILSSSQSGQMASELQEKNEIALSVLNIALSKLFNKIKDKVLHICSDPTVRSFQFNSSPNDFGTIFYGFEEEVEKCNLLIEFVNELKKFIEKDFLGLKVNKDHNEHYYESNWVSIFKSSFLSSKVLAWQMTEVVIPEVLKSTISLSSVVMDTCKFISQMRGSIYNALEQLVEVEMERASLNELEKSYFVKVGQITEQQLALEEAAVKGRDHLSWEEAEELASQEEACKEQLDQLHQTWNQRDAQASSLIKRETDIKNALVSLELQFQSVVNGEEKEVPNLETNALLALLVSSFSELESLDSKLSSSGYSVEIPSTEISAVAGLINSGHPLSDYVWKVGGFLNSHSFFIWKIRVIDSLLNSCISDMASSVEQNLGLDHLLSAVKKKLEYQLQKCISQYLNERVVPSFLVWLDKDNENLKQTEAKHELVIDQMKMDETVRSFVLMLEEYCNAHETARAANSAANLMRRQVNELKEALRKTSLEVVQMEWMHGASLNLSYNSRIRSERFLDKDDRVYSLILDSSRSNILENIQTAVSKITRSLDCLQSCALSSARAEEQLDRAMVWACGGPNSSATAIVSSKSSGIPLEFHEHIKRRREILREAREKASEIVNLSLSVLEFEASRDGILLISGDPYTYGATVDSKTWQQAYLNALTRLDVTYHSYARAEQEWKLAQSTMEAASNGLYTATNELCTASLKAKSASGDLQKAVLSMRDCAYEADVALSGFGRVSRTHTSLTSECGSMLEEVLAVTEDLHDVHSLGKEAASVHLSLMQELSKANSILLPLEAVLSKDVTAMTNTISMERETKMEISHIHGQAIYQSYCLRIREAYQNFKPLVPSLTSTVKTLYSMLTRLARTASLHAGNLHKALEGIGESQELKSEDVSMSRSEPSGDATQFDDKDKASTSRSDDGDAEEFPDLTGFSLQEKGWLSPPDSVCSSSSGSGLTSAEASIPDNFKDPAESIEQDLPGSGSIQVTDHVDSSFSPMNLEENSDSLLSDSGLLDVEANDFASTSLETNKNSETAIEASTESLTVSCDALNSGNENSGSSDGKEVNVSLYKVKSDDQHEEPAATTYAGRRVGTGKNAYASSVLRRVEMKIDGRDIYENREIEIAEQVDYLLKQATSLDNLCNMYEGWTPWI